MIDSHVHYDHRRFDSDRASVLETIRHAVGVELAINPPIRFDSNFTMRQALRDCPWIRFALGVHPNHVDELERSYLSRLAALKDGRTVAVGETGLDYFRIREPERREAQALVFRQHIDLAQQLHLPLILHVRDAWEDALAILRAMGSQFDGVLHCFAADEAVARAYLDLGFRLGIGGTILKPACTATRGAVASLPPEIMVLETDCPFPVPGMQGRSSSEALPMIAKALADLQGRSPDEITAITTETARELFQL